MNEYETNLLRHIEEYGCSVTSVFDPDGADPPFSYSIGIAKSCGAPEVIVFGLESKVAHSIVNVYNRRAQAGERFEEGVDYDDFLEGYPVRFTAVPMADREEFMRSACWLHGGPAFPALQLIWPSKEGAWPWESTASEWLRANQPVLSSSGTRPNLDSPVKHAR